MLTGALAPDSGTVKLGANLAMAALDQHRDSLNPDTTVADALTGGGSETIMVGGQPRHVIGYMKDFLFGPEQARTPLGKLSGGERGRLMLAQVLAKPSNVLVLDEPTNDLDLETLDVLENMIGDYAGTVLLISHDRDFLDRLVSSVIVPEGQGRWVEYAGGYTDMLAQRGADLTREARKAAPAKETKEAKSAARRASQRKRKLNFNEKHQIETLPKTIAGLHDEARVLQQRLDDPALFARDRAAFDQALTALGEVQTKLDEAEDRWLELEILREELSGGDRMPANHRESTDDRHANGRTLRADHRRQHGHRLRRRAPISCARGRASPSSPAARTCWSARASCWRGRARARPSPSPATSARPRIAPASLPRRNRSSARSTCCSTTPAPIPMGRSRPPNSVAPGRQPSSCQHLGVRFRADVPARSISTAP